MRGKVSGIGKSHVIITLFISLSIARFLIQAREFRVTGSICSCKCSGKCGVVLGERKGRHKTAVHKRNRASIFTLSTYHLRKNGCSVWWCYFFLRKINELAERVRKQGMVHD